MPSPPEDDAPRHIHKADSGTRMPVEIERKFLVANDGWRSAVIDSEKLRDGLVGEFDGCKVRVRLRLLRNNCFRLRSGSDAARWCNSILDGTRPR